MPIQHIIDDCSLAISRYEKVNGGDISNAYHLYGHHVQYFLKVNDAKEYPGMFEKEARGLQALRKHTPLIVPLVIKCGNIQQEQYLLMKWIEKGIPAIDCFRNFGTGLAMLHRHQQTLFGWEENNYIGSLVQINEPRSTWHIFYAECRILPLVKILFDRALFTKQDVTNAALLCKKTEQLFPEEPPALLHGDLWSGNYLINTDGYATIYDPAVYCGHREMDIGMTYLFGGFPASFYDAYNEAYPLEKNWKQRLPLTQLYHLLVHAILFEGHYLQSSKRIIKGF